MKKKICTLDETKLCDDCGECSKCLIDPNKECDNCGDCVKPHYLGARKITIENIEDAFVSEANINNITEEDIFEHFILHDVKDEESLIDKEFSQEELDILEKAIEDYKSDVEADENGIEIEHIEDIDGLSDLISDEENHGKSIVEEFPGLLKFDKNYRINKNK